MNGVFSIPIGESGKGPVLYATIMSTEETGLIYRTTAGEFESYNVANYGSYPLGVTEIGQTGIYQFMLPDPLMIPGRRYVVLIHEKSLPVSAPSVEDLLVHSGAIEVVTIAPCTVGVDVRSN